MSKVESKIASGKILFRWTCAACNRYGAWLENLHDADRNGGIHDAHEHKRAVA